MIILERYDKRGAASLKKNIVTVRMIVMLATAVVSVFLHTETAENVWKTSISRWLGKKIGSE